MTTKLISSAISPSNLVEKFPTHLSPTRHLEIHRYRPSSTQRGTLDVYIPIPIFTLTFPWLILYAPAISDNIWLTGSDKTLNPKKFYIIIPALFGNGQSSSPSNMPDLRPFPDVLFYDNVRAQHELVTKHLGIKHARAVLGWSMGAGQT
jgi:pimeloyl-ACP methyl ester carboxylesterase